MLSFYQKKWEAYVGLPQDQVSALLKSILKEEKVTFSDTLQPPLYMYDGKKEQRVLKTQGLKMAVIYVSADPLTRFFSKVVGSSRHFGGITYLSITYTKDSAPVLKGLLRQFDQQSPERPWKITHHPRFQYAFLLQLINKWKCNRVYSGT